MKKLIGLSIAALVAGAMAASTASASAIRTLSGAGSFLVAPLVGEWAQEFQIFFGITVNYATAGSQAEINDMSSGAVDFAAPDSPLTSAQTRSCGGCIQVPWALTALGIGYHVDGVGPSLRLSGTVLAEIYLGQVTRWNDPRIRALNPGVHLPSVGITPLYSNASGDTYVFTSYLSRVSPAWRTRIGYGTTVTFPTGLSVSDPPGLVAQLEATNGVIAYVGASYLIAHRLPAAA